MIKCKAIIVSIHYEYICCPPNRTPFTPPGKLLLPSKLRGSLMCLCVCDHVSLKEQLGFWIEIAFWRIIHLHCSDDLCFFKVSLSSSDFSKEFDTKKYSTEARCVLGIHPALFALGNKIQIQCLKPQMYLIIYTLFRLIRSCVCLFPRNSIFPPFS